MSITGDDVRHDFHRKFYAHQVDYLIGPCFTVHVHDSMCGSMVVLSTTLNKHFNIKEICANQALRMDERYNVLYELVAEYLRILAGDETIEFITVYSYNP